MKQSSIMDILKNFLSPLLIAIFGGMFTSTLNEMRNDIKTLIGHDFTQAEQIQGLLKENTELHNRLKELEKAFKDLELKTIRFMPKEATRVKQLLITNKGQICLV